VFLPALRVLYTIGARAAAETTSFCALRADRIDININHMYVGYLIIVHIHTVLVYIQIDVKESDHCAHVTTVTNLGDLSQ
jgi:hypothetical protein